MCGDAELVQGMSPSPGQVAEWVGALSHAPKGFEFDPQGAYERQPVRCFSFTSVFLSLSLSLSNQ